MNKNVVNREHKIVLIRVGFGVSWSRVSAALTLFISQTLRLLICKMELLLHGSL